MNMNSYRCCNRSSQDFESVSQLSILLKLVAEPNRLRLLCVVDKQSHSVGELMDHLPDLSQSLISHHLADLYRAKLLAKRKKGLKVYYQLTSWGRSVYGQLTNMAKQARL